MVSTVLVANFNKNHLPKNSVARESQTAVRETAEILKAHLLIEYYRDERDLIIESLERIDRAYRQRKREQSAVDFDDLEEFAIQLLESEPRFESVFRPDSIIS